MSEKIAVLANQTIGIVKSATGWKFHLADTGLGREGGITTTMNSTADTFDEAVAKIKAQYHVD